VAGGNTSDGTILGQRPAAPGLMTPPARSSAAPAIQPPPASQSITAADVQQLQLAGRRGLWITVEKAPEVIQGGLGQVSETVPEALNHHLGTDIRILMPYLRPLVNSKEPFESTGVKTTLRGPDGQDETFELMQRARAGKPIEYAIRNRHFEALDSIYIPPGKNDTSLGKDGLFKAVMMFDRASKELIPAIDGHYTPPPPQPPQDGWSKVRRLFSRAAAHIMPHVGGDAQPAKPTGETAPAAASKVNAFKDGGIEFIIGHDWLTSPVLHELDPQYASGIGKIFYLHNTYDEGRSARFATKTMGLKRGNYGGHYSPLRTGIEAADVIIANEFYAQRLTSGLSFNKALVTALSKQLQAGHVFDMHHGLSDTYCARNNKFLQSDGYRDLPADYNLEQPTAAALSDMAAFKQQNMAAMQKEFGLKADPEAVVFSWVARPDPFQKGFYLVQDQVESFLDANPHAQVLIAGINPEKAPGGIAEWMKKVSAKPEYQGRLVFPGFVKNDKVVRIASGSHVLMLPSLYEPYGLSQLEAMRVGCLPLVHPVDGNRATVADPHMTDVPERLSPYGQTGIHMAEIDVPRYWKAADPRYHGRRLGDFEREVLADESHKLRQAMDRGMDLATQHPDELNRIRWNAMRYVESQHSWAEIVQRYIPPITAALAMAHARVSEAPQQA
jgi:glycogen synthase